VDGADDGEVARGEDVGRSLEDKVKVDTTKVEEGLGDAGGVLEEQGEIKADRVEVELATNVVGKRACGLHLARHKRLWWVTLETGLHEVAELLEEGLELGRGLGGLQQRRQEGGEDGGKQDLVLFDDHADD